jgi:dihydrofolate reductase
MQKLVVFESVSLDGYFTDGAGNMTWAHKSDPEWNEFVQGNASGGGAFVFGRKTYDDMVRFWPTEAAAKMMPVVAGRMNASRKYVFSRTLKDATWQNTTVLEGNVAEEVGKLKRDEGPGLVILGSGSIVAQVAPLIDELQLVVVPIALGKGRSLFEGAVPTTFSLVKTRSFENGNVVLYYAKP